MAYSSSTYDTEMDEVAPLPACSQPAIDVFLGLTVGEVASDKAGDLKVSADHSLGDIATRLAKNGKSACIVTDAEGSLEALITENDIMLAYWDAVPPAVLVSEWLQNAPARAPGEKVHRLSVPPQTSLAKACELMVDNAVAGDLACRHVVVQDAYGKACTVLSATDIARAFCEHSSRSDSLSALVLDDAPKKSEVIASSTRNNAVSTVMKSRDAVITCDSEHTIRDVLKILLATNQNCALILDASSGVQSMVTPRDAVQAFVSNVPNTTLVREWTSEKLVNWSLRSISSTATISEAAALMAAQDISHIVVTDAGQHVVGIVSSLDVVASSTSRINLAVLRSAPAAGPAVGEVVDQPWHRCAVAKVGITLGDAAKMLVDECGSYVSLECTAWHKGTGWMNLLTEDDVVRAYLQGCLASSLAEDCLITHDKRKELPRHMFVKADVALADAASLMLNACAESGNACHHLVVTNPEGEWKAVLSALDIARGLTSMCSELDVAVLGADTSTVATVMKPIGMVPKCKANDTVAQVLRLLVESGQHAALVVDDNGTPCLDGVVTPRCAIQALVDGTHHDKTIAAWLRNRRPGEGPREVEPTMKLYDAALLMAKHSLHHLVIARRPYITNPIGVLSSLDLVRGVASINASAPFVSLEAVKARSGDDACRLASASPHLKTQQKS
eukprot:TRINITY_DN14621_c0_g1_i1.p1 TRINITY_DN14621_c0_g1~~TRINITY_DN14621_c0_g1_i1.p1  ORF type:complete len:675 (+),score=157.23 TRINITY_DN14621_c0_g1_i1:79-2103(+)